jgi:hypothetical protein
MTINARSWPEASVCRIVFPGFAQICSCHKGRTPTVDNPRQSASRPPGLHKFVPGPCKQTSRQGVSGGVNVVHAREPVVAGAMLPARADVTSMETVGDLCSFPYDVPGCTATSASEVPVARSRTESRLGSVPTPRAHCRSVPYVRQTVAAAFGRPASRLRIVRAKANSPLRSAAGPTARIVWAPSDAPAGYGARRTTLPSLFLRYLDRQSAARSGSSQICRSRRPLGDAEPWQCGD